MFPSGISNLSYKASNGASSTLTVPPPRSELLQGWADLGRLWRSGPQNACPTCFHEAPQLFLHLSSPPIYLPLLLFQGLELCAHVLTCVLEPLLGVEGGWPRTDELITGPAQKIPHQFHPPSAPYQASLFPWTGGWLL